MRGTCRIATVMLLLLITLLGACGSREDVIARYELERELWHARMLDRRLNISNLRTAERDIQTLIAAYRTVIESDPLRGPDAPDWDPAVVKDVKTLIMGTNIILANLHFLSDRFYHSGINFRCSADDPVLIATGSRKRKIALARQIYSVGSRSASDLWCEQYFQRIVDSDEFWLSPLAIPESFLDIPVVMARVYKSRENREVSRRTSAAADELFDKLIRVWPDSMIAEKARLQKIQLKLIREEWEAAIVTIDEMLAHAYGRSIAPRLLLLKGRILLSCLGDDRRALAVLRMVTDEYTDTPEAREAALAQAMVAGRLGDGAVAKQLLRSVERDARVDDAVRAQAMLINALQLKREGNWNESMLMLRRLQNLFPFTEAALEAPLVITSHYIAGGDTLLAARNLKNAKEYYLSVISRRNTLFERGLVVEDYLIENYLMAGKPEEAARLLLEESKRWGWSMNAGAHLKSAHIYANVIGDSGRAKEILKKCLALFMKTRYADVARNSLAALEGNSEE